MELVVGMAPGTVTTGGCFSLPGELPPVMRMAVSNVHTASAVGGGLLGSVFIEPAG